MISTANYISIFSLLTLCFAVNVYALGSDKEAEKYIPYQIKPGDVLSISVWGEPDLQKEVLVLPDKTISYPLIGNLSIVGHSIESLTSVLRNELHKYIPEANVHIAVQQIRGSKVYVIGKVNRPGEYDLQKKLTVLQALSLAGGMSTFADDSEIKVIRGEPASQVAIGFNYADVSKGENLQQNMLLEDGDVVLVP